MSEILSKEQFNEWVELLCDLKTEQGKRYVAANYVMASHEALRARVEALEKEVETAYGDGCRDGYCNGAQQSNV